MTLVCPELGRSRLPVTWVLMGLLMPASSAIAGDEPPDLPRPAATRADEPFARRLSLAKGGEFVNRAAVQWAKAHG